MSERPTRCSTSTFTSYIESVARAATRTRRRDAVTVDRVAVVALLAHLDVPVAADRDLDAARWRTTVVRYDVAVVTRFAGLDHAVAAHCTARRAAGGGARARARASGVVIIAVVVALVIVATVSGADVAFVERVERV